MSRCSNRSPFLTSRRHPGHPCNSCVRFKEPPSREGSALGIEPSEMCSSPAEVAKLPLPGLTPGSGRQGGRLLLPVPLLTLPTAPPHGQAERLLLKTPPRRRPPLGAPRTSPARTSLGFSPLLPDVNQSVLCPRSCDVRLLRCPLRPLRAQGLRPPGRTPAAGAASAPRTRCPHCLRKTHR